MPSLPSAEVRATAMRVAVSAIIFWSIGARATARISSLLAAIAAGLAEIR